MLDSQLIEEKSLQIKDETNHLVINIAPADFGSAEEDVSFASRKLDRSMEKSFDNSCA